MKNGRYHEWKIYHLPSKSYYYYYYYYYYYSPGATKTKQMFAFELTSIIFFFRKTRLPGIETIKSSKQKLDKT